MATLNGTQINNTYPGLIKTTDNAVIGAVEKEITDGEGNASTLKLGTTSASFTGTLDLTGATVTGLPGGAPGLVAGTGANSMESASTLTTTAADAQGANSIALGDNTVAYADGSILIGNNVNDADNARVKVVSIGNDLGTAQRTVNIGNSQNAYGADGVCIGGSNNFSGDFNIGIGYSNTLNGNYRIAIGSGATANGTGSDGAIAVGKNSSATANRALAIGYNADAFSDGAISLGDDGTINVGNDRAITIGSGLSKAAFQGSDTIAMGAGASAGPQRSIAIGQNSSATATTAVAIGFGVTGAISDTVSIKALETQTNSTPTAGGIIMSDAGGTDRRINIDAAGVLQIDSTPVGVPTVFTTGEFTQTGLADSDICYSVVTIPANTFTTGDILEFRSMVKRDGLNNTAYESWWFSTQAQTVGSAVNTSGTLYSMGQVQSNQNGSVYYQKTLWIGASGTSVFPINSGNETHHNSVLTGDPIETNVIDWTVNQYFFYQLWQDSTTGTLTNYGAVLRKIN